MADAPQHGFAIMSDGSVRAGDCSGMSITPERAQQLLNCRGLDAFGESKDDMKVLLAHLLFGSMAASRMSDDSPDDTAASSHEAAGDRLSNLKGEGKKDGGPVTFATSVDNQADNDEEESTPATGSSVPGPSSGIKSKKKKNGKKRCGGRK